jgi:hypothetical protein
LDVYCLDLFHEAAHGLVAFEEGVGIVSVHVDPMGKTAGIRVAPACGNYPAHVRNEKEARISVAGYCAEYLVRGLPGSPRGIHDAVEACVALQYGGISLQSFRNRYVPRLGSRCTSETIRLVLMDEYATTEHLDRAYRNCGTRRAIARVTTLAEEVCGQLRRREDVLVDLVSRWAKLRSKCTWIWGREAERAIDKALAAA